MQKWTKRVCFIGGSAISIWLYSQHSNKKIVNANSLITTTQINAKSFNGSLLSRTEQLKNLQEKEFDILVIGGGATGCGVALDAISRGHSTALVEKFDFASGTSSRSTKLLHGGVRYLQKAIFGLDIEQYRMVKEALSERGLVLENAPHLAHTLPIMLPVYKWWQLPYYYAGIKAYDLVAGRELLKKSYVLSKSKALELFPMLKTNQLVGAIVYYDGQHDDARMCLAVALTSARLGCNLSNYTEVLKLTKKIDAETGKEVVSGALVRDVLTGDEFEIKAKCVVNATGPYTDFIRQLDDFKAPKICQPSSGTHIVLPDYYSPANMGLLDPSTSDGRVIFFLPWEKSTMAGTTDIPCDVTDYPTPTEKEIQFILKEIKNYLSPDIDVRRGDVLSAWSGIRPLVVDPNAKDTQSIARNHIITVSSSNLITIAGGKWTTFRHMAEETVDTCIKVAKLDDKISCQTKHLKLEGAHEWSPTLFVRLIQDYGLDHEVAQHLANSYGDKSFNVAQLAQFTGKRWPVVGKRLHEEFPYIEAEVIYGIREYAQTAIDIIGRRTRLAFLNALAAEEALPKIIEIMSKELGWTKQREKEEYQKAKNFLYNEMGLKLKYRIQAVPVNFSSQEISQYKIFFQNLDPQNRGYVTINDLRFFFQKSGEPINEDQLHKKLKEVDLSINAQVNLGEFLQLMNVLNIGDSLKSKTALPVEDNINNVGPISVTRSGGGV